MADIETFGLKLYLGDGATPTEAFTEIAQITSISELPGYTRNTIDTTELADTVKQFLAGSADPGQVTFEIKFDPAETTHGTASGLLSNAKTRGTNNYVVEIPAATAYFWEFAAVITNITFSGNQDDVIRGTVTMKISGDWTLSTTDPT